MEYIICLLLGGILVTLIHIAQKIDKISVTDSRSSFAKKTIQTQVGGDGVTQVQSAVIRGKESPK